MLNKQNESFETEIIKQKKAGYQLRIMLANRNHDLACKRKEEEGVDKKKCFAFLIGSNSVQCSLCIHHFSALLIAFKNKSAEKAEAKVSGK